MTAGIFAQIMAARQTFGQKQLDNTLNVDIYAAALRSYSYFFYDVTSGSNGYSAGAHYDLVTGLGVSNGVNMANRFFGLIYIFLD